MQVYVVVKPGLSEAEFVKMLNQAMAERWGLNFQPFQPTPEEARQEAAKFTPFSDEFPVRAVELFK